MSIASTTSSHQAASAATSTSGARTGGVMEAWNAFWFSPREATTLAVVRIATGLIALYWLATYSPDLVRFFGPNSLVPVDELTRIRGSTLPRSALESITSTGGVWAFHMASLVVLAAFTAGWWTRVAGLLSLVAVISYINRMPWIAGQAESILLMLLAYLCIAPGGEALSVDACLRKRRLTTAAPGETSATARLAWINTVATRLIQVHLVITYACVFLAMCNDGVPFVAEAGTYHAWWSGEAMWHLAARPYSPMVDLKGVLDGQWIIVNFWTHAVTIFMAAFAIGIWRSSWRRVLLWWAVPTWISLALVTGFGPFCVLMLAGNLAFVEPGRMRMIADRFLPKAA